MKTVSLQKFADNFVAPTNTTLRTAVLAALNSVENAKQLCMMAGQMLLDAKGQMEHGEFDDYIAKTIPEVSPQTCRTWMRAAANIAKALPPLTVDVEVTVSQVLSLPDDELTEDQRKYKQAWFDFTADKTIKECLNSVTVYGDDAHRVDRAINGKTKGGKGSAAAGDRKAFEKFTATKLGHITTFLTIQKKALGAGKKVVGWRELSPVQRTQIGAAFTQFLMTAPDWLLDIMGDQIKQETKMSAAERLSR